MFIIHLLTNLSRKALTRGKELYCKLAITQGIHYMNTNRLRGRSGTLNLAEKMIRHDDTYSLALTVLVI